MVVVERIKRRPGAPMPPRPVPPQRRPMSRIEIAQAVCSIKEQARHLRPPLNMRPEQFHEDKSELVRAIELLEDAVRQNRQMRTD